MHLHPSMACGQIVKWETYVLMEPFGKYILFGTQLYEI